MATTKVFQSLDLVENILSHFDELPHIAGVRYVDTIFNMAGKSLYAKKQSSNHSQVESRITILHKQIEDALMTDVSHYNIRRPIQYNVMMISMIHMLQDIYVIDWSSYLHMDMDQIWKDLIFLMKGTSEEYRFPNCIDTCKNFAGGQYMPDIHYLMSVYDTDRFKVTELKCIAKMKGIPNSSTMKRSKLVKLLVRSETDIYVYNTE